MSTKPKVMGLVLRLPAVRLSFPDLDEPKAFSEGQEPKYGATFLLDPKNPKHASAIKTIKAEEQRMILEQWGSKPKDFISEFMGNGNDKISQQTGEPYQGYEGMIFISGKNKNPPLLLDTEQNEIARTDPRIYGGAYVNATINLYVQMPRPKVKGQGLRVSVRGVQVLGYGDAFGSRASEKEFEDFDSDDPGLAMESDGL